jgi:hypothetical protein
MTCPKIDIPGIGPIAVEDIDFDSLTPEQVAHTTRVFSENIKLMRHISPTQREKVKDQTRVTNPRSMLLKAQAESKKSNGKRKTKGDGVVAVKSERAQRKNMSLLMTLEQDKPGYPLVEVTHAGKVKACTPFGDMGEFLEKKLGQGFEIEVIRDDINLAYPGNKGRKKPVKLIHDILTKLDPSLLDKVGTTCIVYSNNREIIPAQLIDLAY